MNHNISDSTVTIQPSFNTIKYVGTLARIFSPKVINELSDKGSSSTLSKIISEIGISDLLDNSMSLLCFFDKAYAHLLTSYRNEYVYKNVIAQKILLGRHSLNTTAMQTEFRVGYSKADVLIVNGTSHIYEIKTDLDNLDRLQKQLEDYQRFSEYVTVITSPSKCSKIQELIPQGIGVWTLTNACTLRVDRKAESGIQKLSHDVIFDSLRRDEYVSIMSNELGVLPTYPNGIVHNKYKMLFRTLGIELVHSAMLDCIKNRRDSTSKAEFILKAPSSLKAVAVSSNLKEEKQKKLLDCLNYRALDCLA